MTARRYLVAGRGGVLVESDDLEHSLGLLASLKAKMINDPIPGVGEIIPAARTLLINFRPELISRNELITIVDELPDEPRPADAGELVEIEMVYDGADLAEVSDRLKIGIAELVDRHSSTLWRSAFAGFAPGFSYLISDDPIFQVPRRLSPRHRIPAGSVGLADRFSGVYPQASPGGWQLIGRTATQVWDSARNPPALLPAGTSVRFIAREVLPEPAGTPAPQTSHGPETTHIPEITNGPGISPSANVPADGPRPALVVRQAGLQTLVEDAGRVGYRDLGVPGSGALDRPAMNRANRILGNAEDEAILEIPFGSASFEARGDIVVAVTGAPAPVSVERPGWPPIPVAGQQAIALTDGDLVRIGVPTSGLRSVLAVRGGFDIEPVLGSRSTDVLSGLGPAPLRDGAVLGIRDRGCAATPRGPSDTVSLKGTVSLDDTDAWKNFDPTAPEPVIDLDLLLGPRADWFRPGAITGLAEELWTITARSNRVGLRLSGKRPLPRTVSRELPSEGVPLGGLQIPPDGQPILFLADHPTTGGYPVIGTVSESALPVLAQARPGTQLRFRPKSAD